MIVLTADQFYKRISDEGFKDIKFYEGYVPNPKETKHIFFRIRGEDINANLETARQVLDTYKSRFTILAYRQANGSAEVPFAFQVDSAMGSAGYTDRLNGHINPQLERERIRQEVLLDLSREFEMDALKREIQAKNDALNGYQTASGKIGAVLASVIYTFASKNPKFKQAMQGFGITDAEEVKEDNEIPPIKNKQRFDDAIVICLKHLGEDAIIKLAEKLKSNPSAADTLKSFL